MAMVWRTALIPWILIAATHYSETASNPAVTSRAPTPKPARSLAVGPSASSRFQPGPSKPDRSSMAPVAADPAEPAPSAGHQSANDPAANDPTANESAANNQTGDDPASDDSARNAPAPDDPAASARRNLGAGGRRASEEHEAPNDPYIPAPRVNPSDDCEPKVRQYGRYRSVQVNVDANGCNIPGDAANEPSMAIDPTNPNNIVIGWRQFDTIESDFRQAGWAYSHDAGQTWTFPGVLEEGVFRSDPVLAADAEGNFYYYSLSDIDEHMSVQLFKSTDSGQSWIWGHTVPGGDKSWFTVDAADNPGRGHVYVLPGGMVRSTDGGLTFGDYIRVEGDWGTISVGPEGFVYVVGGGNALNRNVASRSSNARFADQEPEFDSAVQIFRPRGGFNHYNRFRDPNPWGLLFQPWVVADHSDGLSRGHVYVLTGGNPNGNDPQDIYFFRSEDRGLTWTKPLKINDDPDKLPAYQWFPMISVAPNGRIDAAWFDTRDRRHSSYSALYYTYSLDQGRTWAPNVQLTIPFDSHVGWPQQNKIGDYCQMIPGADGPNIAFPATFNGEQDVYFMHFIYQDCNDNGIIDRQEIDDGTVPDCNENGIPDSCETECNGNGIPDECDIADGTSLDENRNNIPDECESVIYVQSDAAGADDGSSWDDAFRRLDRALKQARRRLVREGAPPTVEIWVAAGQYKPTRSTNAHDRAFKLVDGMHVFGGFQGNEQDRSERDPDANVTILSGDINGDDMGDVKSRADNTFHVVVARGRTKSALLDGFTIVGGFAHGTGEDARGGGILARGNFRLVHCTLLGNHAVSGGALSLNGHSILIRNCVFQDNGADEDGGAAYIEGANLDVTRSRFLRNQARTGGALHARRTAVQTKRSVFMNNDAASGGAVFLVERRKRATFRNCEFALNTSSSYPGGGAIGGEQNIRVLCTRSRFSQNASNASGGAISLNVGEVIARNCVFDGNQTIRRGGGIWARNLRMVGCAFEGNTAQNGGGFAATFVTATSCIFRGNSAIEAGAFACDRESSICNTAVIGNSASVRTGGGRFSNQAHTVADCTFAFNTSEGIGGGVEVTASSHLEMFNCLIWGNRDDSGFTQEAQIRLGTNAVAKLSYCDVQGWNGDLGGVGNFGLDPLFVDELGQDGEFGTGDEDVRVRPDSPCVDAGSNSAVPPDVFDIDGDGDRDEPLPLDLAGLHRFSDVKNHDDTGEGTPPIVDIGAYEVPEQNR